MRAFSCETCDQLVFFENTRCLRCDSALGFDPAANELVTVARGREPLYCANARLVGCNWLVRRAGDLCASCVLTRARPGDWDSDGLEDWTKAEAAKRRLLFELTEHGLPYDGLAFDLLSSDTAAVVTGHADGIVTLDLAEADPVHRERMRAELDEPYRTLLGHFRHEVGHFYWPPLVQLAGRLERFRELFGDERTDYQAALERHYADGPPPDWSARHVSAYATMHPWEDWAETFAHYLHITDAVQTAAAYGLRVLGGREPLSAKPARAHEGIRDVLDDWLPLSYALNAMNRSFGNPDLYPFVLTDAVVEKLAFVDESVRARRASRHPGRPARHGVGSATS